MSSPHTELLANLLPPVAYDRRGAYLQAELEADGRALDAAQGHAQRMANAMSPIAADDELLADWERVYGLPPCPAAPRAQRIARLLVKINLHPGDQSKASYIRLAALFGYTVTISNSTTAYVWVVRGLPAPAPIAACGLGLGSELFVDYFRVGVHRVGVHPMVMRYEGDTVQNLFESIKPAHTRINFFP